MTSSLPLRYGMNPHQVPARAVVHGGNVPLEVLSGEPSLINILDALTGWQLVRELQATLGLPAAASCKHTAPAGAALGLPLPPPLAHACRVEDLPLSALAAAYARARGADRLASFGDFVALSACADVETAHVLAREVSDGVIAPDYAAEALAVLRRKKGGRYLVLRIDPAWQPPDTERRDVFGLTLEQPRNRLPVSLGEIVTRRRDLPTVARRDLLLAAITLKYTPSNSICLAYDGQAIGIAAGQQARIQSTRLACAKAESWWLRQHPRALGLRCRPGASRPAQDNAVAAWLHDEPDANLEAAPPSLEGREREEWLGRLRGVTLASDGLIPFRDTLDRAARTGVAYVWQPGGSLRDDEVIAAANEHQMVMCHSDQRLFHH